MLLKTNSNFRKLSESPEMYMKTKEITLPSENL